MQHAEKKVLRLMRKDAPQLKAQEVFSKTGYHTEHDAIHMMHALRSQYEPLKLLARFGGKTEKA